MADSVQWLNGFKPEKEFFIGIDSDGCVFDTMELKHKECFCPVFIKYFNLQPVSGYAREIWEFVNLYSHYRGSNRFSALVYAMEYLANRKEVRELNFKIPALPMLADWVSRESKLGNPALKAYLEKNPDHELQLVLDWSVEVNRVIGERVKNIPPFPYAGKCLEVIRQRADAIVVSQTPGETLTREWEENNLTGYVRLIAGQETGSKSEQLMAAARGKYQPDRILMIGDAPGDLEAAEQNRILFYPINPGKEDISWKRFYNEALEKFFTGTYAGVYENTLINEFREFLPGKVPWQEQADALL